MLRNSSLLIPFSVYIVSKTHNFIKSNHELNIVYVPNAALASFEQNFIELL